MVPTLPSLDEDGGVGGKGSGGGIRDGVRPRGGGGRGLWGTQATQWCNLYKVECASRLSLLSI